MGGGCAHYLYIGNVKIFEIWQGEKVTIHMPSGNYLFKIKMWGEKFGKIRNEVMQTNYSFKRSNIEVRRT